MNRTRNFFKEEYILPVILLMALIARLCFYSSFSYSNDELSAIYRATFNSFRDLVSKGFYVDGHPGGVQVWLYYWMKLFGNSEASVRLPFILSGVGAVFMVFLIARRWFNKAAGFYAASLTALLQFPILWSQIARPYSPGLFFSLWMVFAWTKLLFPSKQQSRNIRIRDSVVYGVSLALCMYTHYFSALFGIIVAATGLFYLKKDQRVLYFQSLGLSALLFAPHIPITLNHLSIKGVGEWLGKPGNDWLWIHIKYIFNDSLFILITCLVIISILILINRKNIRFTKFHLFSLLFFLIPFIIGFLYSRLINPVLQNSVLIFSFPFLLILLFSFANPGYNRINYVLLIILNICLLTDLIFVHPYYRKQHFEEFKGTAEFISQWNRNAGLDQITQVVVVNTPWYLQFYLNRYGYHDGFAMTKMKEAGDFRELSELVRSCKSKYFLYGRIKPAPGEAEEIIREKYPYIIDYRDFSGISRVVVFGKKCYTGMCYEEKAVGEIRNNFDENELWEADKSFLTTGKAFSKPTSVFLDKTKEFGPGYQSKCLEIKKFKSKLMVISCKAFVDKDTCAAKLVVSIDSPDGKNKYWSSSDFHSFIFPGEWGTVYKEFPIPGDIEDDDIIKIYPWNKDLEEVYIDDFNIKFFTDEH